MTAVLNMLIGTTFLKVALVIQVGGLVFLMLHIGIRTLQVSNELKAALRGFRNCTPGTTFRMLLQELQVLFRSFTHTGTLWGRLSQSLLPVHPHSANQRLRSTSSPLRFFSVNALQSLVISHRMAGTVFGLNAMLAILLCGAGVYAAVVHGINFGETGRLQNLNQSFGSAMTILAMAGLTWGVQVIATLAARTILQPAARKLQQILRENIDVLSPIDQLAQIQNEVGRLTVQSSLAEKRLDELKNLVSGGAALRSPEVPKLPATATEPKDVKALNERMAAAVSNILCNINDATHALSTDVEMAYMELFQKFVYERDAVNSSRSVVQRQTLGPQNHRYQRDQRDQRDQRGLAQDKNRHQSQDFAQIDQFLDRAQVYLDSLGQVKSSVEQLRRDAAHLPAGGPVEGAAVKADLYRFAGDVVAEVKQSLGHLTTQRNDIADAWNDYQVSLVKEDPGVGRLSQSLPIISACYKSISVESSKLHNVLSNELLEISSLIVAR